MNGSHLAGDLDDAAATEFLVLVVAYDDSADLAVALFLLTRLVEKAAFPPDSD